MTFKSYLKGILLAFIPCLLQAQTISTIAGTGVQGFSGDGGPAINAQLTNHWGMAVDASGNKYTFDAGRLRKINSSGIITTICGNGTYGFSGDGGPAASAVLGSCADIAVDAIGNIYIVDYGNNRIRKITIATGIITTIAGGGFTLNDGGAANMALLTQPYGVAVDASGNVFIADKGAYRVRKVNTSGIITTVAGTGIQCFSGDGGLAINAGIGQPYDVAVNNAGELFILDSENYRIRKVGTNGMINTIAGTGVNGSPQNNVPAINTQIGRPLSIAVDGSSNIYFSSAYIMTDACAVYLINASGILKRYAGTGEAGFLGDGGYSGVAKIWAATGVAVDGAGSVYFADNWNRRIRKVTNDCIYPDAPVSITGTAAICLSGNPTYSITPVPGALSYQWTVPSFLIGSSTTTSISLTCNQPATVYGDVQVTAINSCGAGIPATLTVGAVDMMPAITSSSTPVIACVGEVLPTLTASTDWQVWNTMTYQWKLNGSNIPGATSQSYIPIAAGNYVVAVTAGSCTQSSSQISASFYPTPVATIAGNDFFCMGTYATLTALPSGAVDYQWMNNSGTLSYNATFVTNVADIYRVIVTNSFQCTDTSDDIHLIQSPANADFNNLGTSNLCYAYLSPPEFISTQVVQGNNYQWQLNGTNIPGATNSIYDPTLPGDYNLIVVDSNGCADTSTSWGLLQNSEEAIIYTPSQDTICFGQSVLLEADPSGGIPYQWVFNGVDIPGNNSPTYYASESGVYTLTLTEGTCIDTSNAITVTVLPQLTPVITQNGNDLSVPPIYDSYQWTLNWVSIPGATNNTYTAVTDGNYRVDVTGHGGLCTVSTGPVNVSGLSVTSVSANQLSIYPNPFVTETKVSIDNPQNYKHTFVLYNAHGQECTSKEFTSSELIIERGVLPSGIYHFQLRNGEGKVSTGKLTIL